MKDTLGLLLLVATLVTAGIGLYRTDGLIDTVIESLEGDMATTTTIGPWMSGGLPITVTVVREPDESDAEFSARCRAETNAMLEQFPKDP